MRLTYQTKFFEDGYTGQRIEVQAAPLSRRLWIQRDRAGRGFALCLEFKREGLVVLATRRRASMIVALHDEACAKFPNAMDRLRRARRYAPALKRFKCGDAEWQAFKQLMKADAAALAGARPQEQG